MSAGGATFVESVVAMLTSGAVSATGAANLRKCLDKVSHAVTAVKALDMVITASATEVYAVHPTGCKSIQK